MAELGRLARKGEQCRTQVMPTEMRKRGPDFPKTLPKNRSQDFLIYWTLGPKNK